MIGDIQYNTLCDWLDHITSLGCGEVTSGTGNPESWEYKYEEWREKNKDLAAEIKKVCGGYY